MAQLAVSSHAVHRPLPNCLLRHSICALSSATTFLDTVKNVFTSLNQYDVRYLLMGGLAVAAHGHSRATNDIDLVVALERENAFKAIEELAAAMKNEAGRPKDQEDIRILRGLHPDAPEISCRSQ